MKYPNTYEVTVQGHDPVLEVTRTPGKARANAYHSYTCAYDYTFKRFLQISTLKRVENPHMKEILVQGRPALQVGPQRGNSVPVWLDGRDGTVLSHKLDVEQVNKRRSDAGG